MNIKKRKDNRYYTIINLNGVKRYVYGKTELDCRRRAEQLLDDSRIISVDYWANEWINLYSIDWADSTVKQYKTILNNHIIPNFKGRNIDSITHLEIQKLITNLSCCLATKYVKNIYLVLHGLFHTAYLNELIYSDPTENIKLPRLQKTEIKAMTQEQAKIYLENLPDNVYGYALKFDLLTGLRIAELIALSPQQIDFENKTLLVDRQVTYDSVYKTKLPKHGKKRTVPLTNDTVEILEKVTSSQRVFMNNDKPLSRETLHRNNNIICSKLFNTNFTIHSLRHTYAMLLLQAGVDLKTIQQNLGHYSHDFTLDCYIYSDTKSVQDSAVKLEEYINLL